MSLVNKIKSLFGKEPKSFNVLLTHEMTEVRLLSEIQIVAYDVNQAKEIAKNIISRVNKRLGSKFVIDKLWEISQKPKLRSKGKLVQRKGIDVKRIKYPEAIKYLKEEFNYVIKK
jgi:hypothetical protein